RLLCRSPSLPPRNDDCRFLGGISHLQAKEKQLAEKYETCSTNDHCLAKAGRHFFAFGKCGWGMSKWWFSFFG
ncbi:MAG: hypothetical protein ABI378_04525, partial [Chitinophagaceae bacterium]